MSNMFLNVVSTFKGDGLAAATRQLGAFGQASSGLGSTLGKVGAALASFGLATKAIKFGKDSIDSARDLERNLFSVNTIFDEFSPKIVQFTKDAEQLGLSQKDAAKASTFLGSVLKQSGFSMDFVTNETQKLVSLGVDLAATYGYDVQEALLGMTALFRGEYDPIEKFGVAMKQSEINAELAARKLDKLEGSARRNAEQTIRLELLYQRAADATGAFSAQSGNLYVEQKKLQAQFENMQAQIGTDLLPVFGQLVEALVPLVDDLTPKLAKVVQDSIPVLETLIGTLKDMSDETTTTGQTFGALTSMLGNTFRLVAENLGVIVQLAIVFGTARVAVVLFNAALKVTPVAIYMTTIGSLIASLIVAADTFKRVRIAAERAGDSLTETQKDGLALQGALTGFNPLKNPLITLLQEAVKWAMRLTGALDLLPKEKIIKIKLEADTRNKQLGDYLALLTGRANEPGGASFDQGKNQDDKGGAGKKPEVSGLAALIADAEKATLLAKKRIQLQNKDLSKEVIDFILSTSKPVKAANDVLKLISKNAGAAIKKLTELYKKSAAGRAAAAQAIANQLAEEEAAEEAARLAREARIEEQKRVYESFLDSIKSTFGGIKEAILGAFDITALGGSTNSIIRNLNKLLSKTRDFAANISKLSSMGLDPALLQQVISAGPMAGARLAAALVQGGVGALGQINAAYGEFGNLATSIATTGTNALFGTQAQQNVYNINVSGGVGSGATIGQAIVQAIKDYERVSGAVWQGA